MILKLMERQYYDSEGEGIEDTIILLKLVEEQKC